MPRGMSKLILYLKKNPFNRWQSCPSLALSSARQQMVRWGEFGISITYGIRYSVNSSSGSMEIIQMANQWKIHRFIEFQACSYCIDIRMEGYRRRSTKTRDSPKSIRNLSFHIITRVMLTRFFM